MEPIYFETPGELRGWLEANHATASELVVGLHRKETGRPSLTWPELVDEALCFGWIDGIRRRVDERRFTIRLTPRKRGSFWSAVNIANVARLTAEGRMTPPGLAAFALRDEAKSRGYSYERGEARLPEDMAARFQGDDAAWAFWVAQPPGYRRLAAFWVNSAKRDETRQRRFARLLADSAAGRRIGALQAPGKRAG